MPEPPRNVRVARPDGTVIPVEMVYAGVEDGQHVWEAVTGVMELDSQLLVEMLPASTSIRIKMNEGDD